MTTIAQHAKPPRHGTDWRPPPVQEPDPGKPAFLHRYNDLRTRPIGNRWIRHQERRSQILAAARRVMSEVEFAEVSVRAIADTCEVSIPTIYNVVGDRARVIADAAAEWVTWLAIAADARSSDHCRLLALLDAIWISVANYPDYSTHAARAQMSREAWIGTAFRATGEGLVANLLQELQSRDLLRPAIDPRKFAWHLTQSVHAGICQWATAPYDHEQFRREFASGPGLMLLGAVTGTEAERVARGLDSIARTGSL